MDGQRIAAVLFAVLMVTSMVAVPGSVAAQEGGPDAAEPASYYGSVTIDGENAPVGTTVSAVANGTVVDTIEVTETGRYGAPGVFEPKLVVDAQNASNGTPVEFRVNGNPVTRTEPSNVEWESGDVQRVDLRAGSLDPIYEFDVEDFDETVPRGDDAEITVSVENTGTAGPDELTVTATGEDEPRTSRELDLDANESSTEVLSVPTREDDGDQITLTVATDEESTERTVTLRDPSNFTVSLALDTPADGEGEQYDPFEDDLNGSVTVENVGEVADEQNVSVSFGDETLVDRAVELDGGNDTQIEFNRTLIAADAGDTTVTATTDDDIATRTISVLQPGALEVDVIEDESTLSPVARQNVSVVAEITNVGEAEVVDRTVNLTNVTADASSEVASREFTLAPGESQDFEPAVETTDPDAGSELTYEVATGDDTETVDVTVEDRDAFLDVTIDGLNDSSVNEPAVGETVPVRVDATVENLGTGATNGEVTFTADGEEFATRPFDSSTGTQTYNVTYDAELGDAPEVTIGAATTRQPAAVVQEQDASDETTLGVTPQAQFAVSIDKATNVTDDLSTEEFAPTIAVENLGGQSASGDVTVFFNGTEQQDPIEFSSLGPDASETVVQPNDGFSINASDFEEGEYLLEAEVANDATGETSADTDRVAIGEVANFSVTDVTVPSSADQGETIDIEATVENTGGVDAEKPVTVEVGDQTLQTTTPNLTADEETDLTVGYTPTSAVAGTTSTAAVSTPDDEASDSVSVRANAEFTADLTVDETAIAGDTVTAAVTVANEGGNATNTTDIRLLVDGEEVANATDIELASGEQTTEQFEISTDTAGELAVQGVTDDDVASATVDVGDPGELDLSVRSITDPVTTDENVTVSVAAENVGDGDLEGRRVRLSIDGSLANTTTVDVAGGATETVELTSGLDRTVPEGETETAVVSVIAPEDRADRDVTVRPEPDDPYFRVDGLEASADEVLNTPEANVTVNATVTNIGDLDGEQDVDFTAGSDVSATTENLTIEGNGTAKEVSFEFDVSELNLDLDDEESTNVTYGVGTENQTDEGTLTVIEPDPPTPELVEVAVDETATQEEPLTATVSVLNAGDQPLDGNETVTLDYEDGSLANESVALNTSVAVGEGESLAPGAEAEIDLSVSPPPEPLAGTFDREVTVGFGSEEFADDTVTRTVAVDFEGVASGVDAAEASDTADTVTVRPGEYQARNTIEIPGGVTVESSSPVDAPVISQPSRADETAVRIVGGSVTLDGLTFEGAGNGTAVEIADGGATLTSLRATNWTTGIDETAGTNALTGVEISDAEVGIRVAGDNGTAVDFARVTDTNDVGILVESGENEIAGAEVLRSATGIELRGANNVVQGATVRNSADYGVRATEVPGGVPENATASDIEDNPSVTVTDSVLESNGVSLFSDDSYADATDNWWGGGAPVQGSDWVARSVVDDGDPRLNRPASNFTVADSGVPDSVLRGETFSVEPTIENDGTGADRQRIELRRGDGTVVDSQPLGLNASESGTVTLTGSTSLADGESISLTVAALAAEETADSVGVDDPAAFALGDVSAENTAVPLGNEITVDAPIDNVGDRQGTVTARLLDVNGDEVASTEVDLAGAASETPSLTWETDVQGSGQVTVEVLDSGTVVASDTLAVDVGEPALTGVSLSLGDEALTVNDTTTVSVDSVLTDGSGTDVTGDATTTIRSNDSSIVSVDGATLTAESVGTATITAEYDRGGSTATDTATVTVEAEDDTDEEPEEDPPTTGGGGGGGGGGFVDDQQPGSLELDATAIETVTPSLELDTDQRVATTESVENVESIAFDTTDQIGEVTVADVDPETTDVDPPGGTVTLQEIAVPDDATDQSATIRFRVSAERLDAVGAPAEDLSAVRLTDDGWETLETSVAEETDGAVTLEAQTPGFSVFAVNAVGQPDATAAVDPGTATAGESVTLDGSGSTTEYGEIASYEWSVADQTLTGETASATLDEAGEYAVELTVTNDAGETDTATATLTVEAADDATADGADGADGADDAPDEEPAGLGVTVVVLLVAVAILAAAAVVLARREE